MGLITKEVEIILHKKTKYYESLGYYIHRIKDSRGRLVVKSGTKILVKVKDLCDGSHVYVEVECDNCYKKLSASWKNYKKVVKSDGKYYCRICASKLYGGENKRISQLKNGKSFEEWCIENNKQDVLCRWDYTLNEYKPSEISFCSNKKMWFCCPIGVHKSELKCINNFTNGQNDSISCSQCNSFGYKHSDALILWSNKNSTSPYDYSHCSDKYVWWKCPNNKHNDFKRKISQSYVRDFRCPKCQFSKGEKNCENFLKNQHINYISQKTFNNLKGVGNRLLSYDFYLPDYDLLIEYQGQYHDGTVSHQSYKDFKIQQEHDKRKREYAKSNNINLLEIWYWDYDKIDEILTKELDQREAV